MLSNPKYLITVVGPTAVGKTSLSIDLALKLNSEIISLDSRQFYKELAIGTAKPSVEELGKVQHHFVNNLSIKEDYNVMQFEKEALIKIDELHQNSDFVVMVGGSGLFYKAICEGFDDIPDVDPKIRVELNQELIDFGKEKLQNELMDKDLKHYQQMDIQNSQRLIRALEICRGTGKPYSSFRKGEKKERPFKIIKIGLEMEREQLYHRIDSRMNLMLEIGLVDEVKSLEKYKTKNALQTVGYKEVFEFFEANYDWEECVRLLKRNSRRYAKRQLTWFKKDKEISWFNVNPNGTNDTFKSILKLLKPYLTSGVQG